MDGWRQCSLGLQRDGGGGCATIPERYQCVEGPDANVDN